MSKTKPKKKPHAAKPAKKKATPAPKAPAVPSWKGGLDQVAAALNLGGRRVQQLAREGLPKAERGVYDVFECLKWYARYLQKKLVERALPEDGDGDGGGPATSSSATKHKLLSIEMELKQIELAERREQLISIDKVTKDFSALAVEIKTRILALPPRLAAEILGETDLAVAQSKVEKSLKGALESLAQYDPDRDALSKNS